MNLAVSQNVCKVYPHSVLPSPRLLFTSVRSWPIHQETQEDSAPEGAAVHQDAEDPSGVKTPPPTASVASPVRDAVEMQTEASPADSIPAAQPDMSAEGSSQEAKAEASQQLEPLEALESQLMNPLTPWSRQCLRSCPVWMMAFVPAAAAAHRWAASCLLRSRLELPRDQGHIAESTAGAFCPSTAAYTDTGGQQ